MSLDVIVMVVSLLCLAGGAGRRLRDRHRRRLRETDPAGLHALAGVIGGGSPSVTR